MCCFLACSGSEAHISDVHRFPLIAFALIGITYYLLDTQIGFALLPKDPSGHSLGAPLNADLGLLVASFLMIGSWWQDKQQGTVYSSKALTLCFVLSLTLFGVCLTQGPDLDLNFRIAKVWPIALLSGILGIAAVLSMSHLIDRHTLLLKQALVLLGQHTLIILIFHAELQRQVIHLLTKLTPANGVLLTAVSFSVCFALAWFSKYIINRHKALRQIFYVK